MGGRIGTKVVTERGSIGRQVFDQVEQLTAQGSMTRLAAFKQIGAASGRAPGTVAANYYRIARQRGVPLQSRRPRGPSGTAQAGLSRIRGALQAVASALRAQEAELAELRSQSAAFQKLRRLLKS